MAALCEKTAKDIRDCSNTCDTYSRKKLIVKVLQGPVWDGKLTSFVGLFVSRKDEFMFALSIHTAIGVDTANRVLADVEKSTREANERYANPRFLSPYIDFSCERIDLLLQAFQKLIPPEQQELQKEVTKRGSLKSISESDAELKKLLSNQLSLADNEVPTTSASKKDQKAYTLADLKKDLEESIDVAVEKNMEVFSRKLEMQQRQLREEVERVVVRESDRVIQAVSGGPHDRIIDRVRVIL